MSKAQAAGRGSADPQVQAAQPPRFVDLWLIVPEPEADWAAELLCELGSSGALESPEAGGRVRVLGAVPGERAGEVRARLQAEAAAALASGRLRRLPELGSAASAEVDWQEVLRRHHRPFRVRDLLVRPPWVEPDGGPEIVLKPGMAFGTGSHETTRLCLEALAAELERGGVLSLLDVGTGSGILALVALRLAEKLKAVACDIDPDAILCASAAAEANGLSSRIRFHARGPDPAWGPFDLVVANLQWNVFQEALGSITAAVAPQGVLLCSGLLLEQAGAMAELAGRFGLRLHSRTEEGEWCLLRFSRAARGVRPDPGAASPA
jgi:ribosomal protein L11 methyltransferase